jgi:hypothetical protein
MAGCALAHIGRARFVAMSLPADDDRESMRPNHRMRMKTLDLLCIAGSLVIAIGWRAITGDGDGADRAGLAFLLSWTVLLTLRYLKVRTS